MCRMCDWMGDGGIWYLNPKNYGHRLYKKREPGGQLAQGLRPSSQTSEEPQADERTTGNLMRNAIEAKANGDLDTFHSLIKDYNDRSAKTPGCHVLPLADAFKVMDLVQGPIGAMMCICRKNNRGEEASSLYEYSCLGLGTGMLKWERWPERYRGGVEFLSPSQAKEWLDYWDKRGYVHMVMQEGQNFIGGICNCDYPTCMPIRYRLDYGVTSWLVKGEYVAKVDYDRCNGCGDCMKRCQFGALRYEVALNKANIDPLQCFGCGVCAPVCRRSAIEVLPKKKFPALADVW